MNKYNVDQEVICHNKNYFVIKFREIFGTYQYSLSKTKGGEFVFACGEFSIDGAVDESESNHNSESLEPNGLALMRKVSPPKDEAATRANTISSIMRQPIDGSGIGLSENVARLAGSSLFFKPSRQMVKWLIEYAGGRTIIDVGAGQGHLVRMIKQCGGKAFGLEPNFDQKMYLEQGAARWGDSFDINEILPWMIERATSMISEMRDKALLVFARPCHSDFVYNGIDLMPIEMEALYITIRENLEKYDDLGKYKARAIQLSHRGTSEDEEVVISIKKQ